MENRKETLSFVKICRFCLAQNKSLTSLYDKNKLPNNTVTLPLKILSSVSIEVLPSDKKPTYICERCKFFMNMVYEYKSIVSQADEAILHFIQNGTPLATITWPNSLNKIFRSMYDLDIMKTVVEGGATIQVTSHDISDSDEDDANIYNVKIGDDEDSKTCIKVVTSKENKIKDESQGTETEEIIQQEPEKESEENIWACDQCNCTYPLQQLLDLHKKQKHRPRNFACDQCDAKFFSKYDLGKHLLQHSCETPFPCAACGKQFKRLILLKRHEKLIHPEMPQLLCANCPATFLTVEQLQEHQKKHARNNKPFACPVCEKRFYERSSMLRHQEGVHNKTATLCCKYCPERFGSVTKLARHVRSHAGERLYPCKICGKSFLKSHHYTRHLRVKHPEAVRSRYGDQENYRCEQCDDVFDTQDDLIYHSAIHATQNLTCPLCQEKFTDVVAVTVHIKSHVDGVEFMCDYCELIFTTQEKLDIHTGLAHVDEIKSDMHDESSMELGDEDEEDDNEINVKEEGDHMVIEIKNPNNYLMSDIKQDAENKTENTNSEESESETTYTDLQTVDTMAMLTKEPVAKSLPEKQPEKPASNNLVADVKTNNNKAIDEPTGVFKKPDEIKRRPAESVIIKKSENVVKVESSNVGGTSDKSLRLLEKELQDLKRTNSRNIETTKGSSGKALETPKGKRPQFLTSTPKLRSGEEKKILNRSLSLEKKQPEKRTITKENKEPKEIKEAKNNNDINKDDKDNKEKDVKEKDKDEDNVDKDKAKETDKEKGKETPKSIIKNGSSSERSITEDGVRRSTRPSKIRDYAKMIRDRSQEATDDDDDTTEDDEDYKEPEKVTESRKTRRPSQAVKTNVVAKTPPAQSPGNPPRKRGRPRKENKETPAKIKKNEDDDVVETSKKSDDSQETSSEKDNKSGTGATEQRVNKTPEPFASPSGLLVSPTGHTLKKVSMKALPPGVKPLPLPPNARPITASGLCEMQIGKKVVKVQKIVMTKAEVEAMAKKGLVEMKDGTMVLKQGIKLPTSDASAVKSTLIGDGESSKEPPKRAKAAPTRCDLGDDS